MCVCVCVCVYKMRCDPCGGGCTHKQTHSSLLSQCGGVRRRLERRPYLSSRRRLLVVRHAKLCLVQCNEENTAVTLTTVPKKKQHTHRNKNKSLGFSFLFCLLQHEATDDERRDDACCEYLLAFLFHRAQPLNQLQSPTC